MIEFTQYPFHGRLGYGVLNDLWVVTCLLEDCPNCPIALHFGGSPSLLHLPEEEGPSYKGQLCAGCAHTPAC